LSGPARRSGSAGICGRYPSTASRTESLRCHRQCDAVSTATGEHLTVLRMLLSLEDHESGAAWYMAMNVGDWLRSLGLGKYEATFRDSEIDSDILHELTESDLEKLGLPLGHRKRLLKAIVGLDATATAPSTATLRLGADAAERRHLSVMFIDL